MNNEEETWRDIKGFEGRYKISNLSRIMSFQKRTSVVRVLNPCIDSTGYYVVTLRMKPKNRVVRVHVLMAETFLPEINGKKHVNHIDGNKLNNNITNLERCTPSENNYHAWRTGLTDTHGDKSPNALLSKDLVIKIREMHNLGFNCVEIKKELNLPVGRRHILDIVKGVNWKSVQ